MLQAALGLRVVFLLSGGGRVGVGWRRSRRSERGGNEWHAREKERPWQALGTPVVVYTWLGMHGGAGAER
jgi:hypothetical protein